MDEKILKRNLSLLVFSMVFGNVLYAITGTPMGGAPLTGFIRLLGANDFAYGLVMALPVLGGILQIFGSYLVEATGRRKLIFLVTGYTSKFLWLITALVPIIMPRLIPGISKEEILTIVTVLILINAMLFYITVIAGTSILGAIIPMDIKGRFMSVRSFAATISIILAAVLLGLMLDKLGAGLSAFAIVMAICVLFGSLDITSIALLRIPPMAVKKERTHFLRLMAKPLKDRNYMRFVIFFCVWNFSLNFVFPSFSVYMIEYLKMSYLNISLAMQIAAGLATVLLIRIWGAKADSHGNKPVIMMCGLLLIPIPLLWLFTGPGNIAALFLYFAVYGACFPAYELSAFNLSLWLAPEENRSIYPALATFFNSIFGIALPYVLGGLFLQVLGPIVARLDFPFIMGQKLSAYHLMFILSTLMRIGALLIFLPRFKEEGEKPVKEMLGSVFTRFIKAG